MENGKSKNSFDEVKPPQYLATEMTTKKGTGKNNILEILEETEEITYNANKISKKFRDATTKLEQSVAKLESQKDLTPKHHQR